MEGLENNIRIAKHISRYLTRQITEQEQRELDAWLLEDKRHQHLFDRIVDHESLAVSLYELAATNTEQAYREVKIKIDEEPNARKTRTQRIIPLKWLGIAASAVLVGIASFLFLKKETPEAEKPPMLTTINDVAPGGNKATLTLADGSIIDLSDSQEGIIIGENEIKYQDGSSVLNDDAVRTSQRVSLSTPNGGQYQITLSDGTKVWLNAGSKLSYPRKFTGSERRVELQGEAYFEVAKQQNMQNTQSTSRFIVSSAGQEVIVLGTHFNINAYPDEKELKTTLLEGSVQVSTSASSTTLSPGQQAIQKNGILKTQIVNTEDEVAWKNGYFMFNNEDLESIMKKIGRWYALAIKFEDPTLKAETFFGTMSKFENSSKVLNMLERTGIVRFEITDNTLNIRRKR